MIKKHYSKTRNFCRVTFKLPPEIGAEKASVCGEFNNWDPEAKPMTRLKDGGFSVTVSVDAPKSYRFRYFLDGERWENDWEADAYVKNEYGTEDSVVEV